MLKFPVRKLVHLALSVSLILGQTSLAGEPGLLVSHPQRTKLNKSLHIVVTERGREYFRNHLDDLLKKNNKDLTKGLKRELVYTAKEPIDLDNLPPKMQAFSGVLSKVRDALRTYFSGFNLNNPKAKVAIEDLQWNIKFQRLGMNFEGEVKNFGNIRDGIQLSVEAIVSDITATAKALRVKDLNNSIFDSFDFRGEKYTAEIGSLRFQMKPGSEPFKVKIPVAIGLVPGGGVEAHVVGYNSNLDKVQLLSGFTPPLKLPQVELRINGRPIVMDPKAVENELVQRWPDLTRALQTYLADYLKQELPNRVNSFLNQYVKGNPVEDNNIMNVPNAPATLPLNERLVWGMRAEAVKVVGPNLHTEFSAFVEDPTKGVVPPTVDLNLATAEPPLFHYGTLDYDIALAINQGFVNRILQHGFNRGFLNKIDTDDPKSPLKLRRAPFIQLRPGVKDHELRIVIDSESINDSFFAGIAVKNPVHVRFDAYAKLVPNGRGGFKLVTSWIDANNLWLNPDSVKLDFLFYNKVVNAVKKRLQKASEKMQASPTTLIEDLGIPNKVGGIGITIKDAKTDPSGYVVLYLNYEGVPR